MKRALAERVKQDMGDPVIPPSAPPSSMPGGYASTNGVGGETTGHPPSKMPRLDGPVAPSSSLPGAPVSSSSGVKRPRSPNATSSGNMTAFQSQTTGGGDATPRGRGRKSSTKQQDSSDEDDGDNSSFYLKQQNTSLASELYAYRRRIYLLEREREFRRRECRLAERKIGELSGVWKGLESALGKELERNELLKGANPNNGSSSAPACTGSGTDVETTNSLLHSLQSLVSNPEKIQSKEAPPQDPQHHVDDLNNFESYSKGTLKMEEDEDLVREKRRLKEMEDFASDIANRSALLRDSVLGLLQGSGVNATTAAAPQLQEQIARLESDLKAAETKLEEMANARNEAAASERRVRRGLYRLASSRMTVDEVLKAVEKEDNGVSFMETLAMIDGMNNSSPDGATTTVVSSADGAMSSPALSAAAAGGSKEAQGASSEEVAQLKKSLQDTQAIAETRDKKIAELLAEREEQMKQVNSLMLPKGGGSGSPGEDAIQKSPLFIDAMTKLRTSERRVKELETTHGKIMEKWAAVKGDLDLAKKTMAEMEDKHSRRWTELVSQFSEADQDAPGADSAEPFSTSKKTAELESKLLQAMESVNRMETMRATLADAYKMNEQLQSKLEDLRTKNAKMVAEKVATREKNKEAESNVDATASPHSSSGRKSSSGDPAYDKLHRDYRKARKELSAAVLSKDQAKLKQERAEKERDALMKTNARLLKQSSDKDDMNAKSLSTILHLKQRNEELGKENAIIKEKVQASQQLNLAARLAANAKERVGEEAMKEKEALDETVKQLQKDSQTLRAEKDQVEGLLQKAKEETASVAKDLDAARSRCDDLVSEVNKKEEEKKQMMESLAVVKKEAMESALQAAAAAGGSGGGVSAYTMEQMTTQVKYLHNKVNCPVCNVREKKCILLRCRHMFCQQCVDVNIKNRSRKCPACAQRFDMKDVAEIWL